MYFTDVMGLFVAILVPAILLLYVIRRWFSFKEKQLELSSRAAAQRAAEYAVSNNELEQRVRVLEQIVTDNGAETAAQIEALRQSPPRIAGKRARIDNDAA